MSKYLATLIATLYCAGLSGQVNQLTVRYFAKLDNSYIIVDDSKDHWYTLELKADTIYQDEDNLTIYDNKKLLQINVIPFSEILPNQKKPMPIMKALDAYRKWELKYQEEAIGCRLKSGKEYYYRDKKPFLIWWHKNPPSEESSGTVYAERVFDIETGTYSESKTLNVTHMLCLNFSIYAHRNVALTIPVFEDELLQEEVEKLKDVANSLRVYGGNIDMDVLLERKHLQDNYVFSDSLNLLQLEVPDWLNVIEPPYENTFSASFPEWHEAVNAMIIRWEYRSDSLTFDGFVNNARIPHEHRPNFRLIAKNDTTLRYFYTSEDGWFHQQNVYLAGENIFCLINFTATKYSYQHNIGRFEEMLSLLNLK